MLPRGLACQVVFQDRQRTKHPWADPCWRRKHRVGPARSQLLPALRSSILGSNLLLNLPASPTQMNKLRPLPGSRFCNVQNAETHLSPTFLRSKEPGPRWPPLCERDTFQLLSLHDAARRGLAQATERVPQKKTEEPTRGRRGARSQPMAAPAKPVPAPVFTTAKTHMGSVAPTAPPKAPKPMAPCHAAMACFVSCLI